MGTETEQRTITYSDHEREKKTAAHIEVVWEKYIYLLETVKGKITIT